MTQPHPELIQYLIEKIETRKHPRSYYWFLNDDEFLGPYSTAGAARNGLNNFISVYIRWFENNHNMDYRDRLRPAEVRIFLENHPGIELRQAVL